MNRALLTAFVLGFVPLTLPSQEESKSPAADPEKTASGDHGYKEMEVLTRAIETLRKSYVDLDRVAYDKLVEGALEGMLRNLDPHSGYLRPRVYERMQKEQTNTYEGFGITLAIRDDALTIINVRESGAAARAGVAPGDLLIRIGDIFTERIGLAEVVQLLSGEPGEEVKITVRRPSTRETLEFALVREVLQRESVRDGTVLDKAMAGKFRIGYVRITEFKRPTVKELSEALDRIEAGEDAEGEEGEAKPGLDALVLDLRNNPGGLLGSAVGVCGEFLEPETVVVTTRGRAPELNPPPYRTPKRGDRPNRDYPVAVLVNVGSASGSEIVAGALQDLGRAIVVGETTFGKGSVQSVIPLSGGGAMKLTTARYYTPSKNVIHGVGIVPDIVATLTPERERELLRWRGRARDASQIATELAGLEDSQLERAVDALKGVLVLRSKE